MGAQPVLAVYPVSSSDAELANQALDGSQSAWRELVVRYSAPAVIVAARLVRNRALAEDLAQEAFLRVFQGLAGYDPQRRFSSWFFRIVHNVTIDYLRHKRAVTISLDELTALGHPGPTLDPLGGSPEVQAERAELARALERGLGRLRPDYREALVLRYQEGLSQPEIAEVMGLAGGTVKTYLYRGRKELAASLSADGWGPPPAGFIETVSRDDP